MVVGNGGVVVDDVIPCPREAAVVGDVGRIVRQAGIKEVTILILIALEVSLTIVGVAGREGGLEVKALDDVELHIEVTEHAPGLALLVDALHLQQGVGLIGELIGRCAQGGIVTGLGIHLTLRVVWSHIGVHSVGALNSSVVGILLNRSGTIEAEAGADHLVELGINASLEVDTVGLIAFVDAFLTVITHTQVVVDVLATGADGQVVVLLAAVLGHHAGPVISVAVGKHLLHTEGTRALRLTEQTLLEDCAANLIDGMRGQIRSSHSAITSVGQELHETEIIELLSGHKLRHTSGMRPTVVSVVADGRLGSLFVDGSTALSGYHHDTGCSTRTVDGGRRSVLQNIDTLNVLRIQPVDIVAHHTVDHIERCGVGVDGRPTADLDVVAAATTRGLGDAYTWVATLQVTQNRGSTLCVQLLSVDRRHRTGEVLLLNRTVTDDHHILKSSGILLEDNVYTCLSCDVNILRLHTDV